MFKWLLKLRRFGTISKNLAYWELGRFYGYPTCCIKNFVNMTILSDEYDQLELNDCYRWMLDNIGPATSPIKGYVECVVCRTKTIT